MASKARKPKERTMAQQTALQRMAEVLAKRYPIFTAYEILQYQEEFALFDEDESGDIDTREICKLFNALGEPIPKKAAAAVIAQFDKDGEGSIDFEEFVNMMYQLKTGRVNASDGFLRAYMLQQASYETILDMVRTSSTNLTDLSLAGKHERGQDGRLYEGLKSNSQLTSLNLSGCGLQEQHAKLIGDALLDNSALVKLNLSDNAIVDAGFEKIADALCMPPDSRAAWEQVQDAKEELADLRDEYHEVNRRYNAYLEQLRRENSIIHQVGNTDSILFKDPAAQKHFNQIRQQNENLLDELEKAGLREMDALEYYAKQKGNVFVTELLCNACYLYDASGHYIARTLLWNKTLTSLQLERNGIGSAGTQAIAKALVGHPTLRALNLSANVCGADAGTALASMLMANTVLTDVQLADNCMSNSTARVMTQMLHRNTSLLSLDLSSNLFTAEPCKDLCRALAQHHADHGRHFCTQLILLRNELGADQQLQVTQILGKDWKYKKSTAGMACKLRKMPSAENALEALTHKQHANLESAFFAFDEDGSGEMDASELAAAADTMGMQVPPRAPCMHAPALVPLLFARARIWRDAWTRGSQLPSTCRAVACAVGENGC
jgi:Ca2+-binding EF-hand superfamily protein